MLQRVPGQREIIGVGRRLVVFKEEADPDASPDPAGPGNGIHAEGQR